MKRKLTQKLEDNVFCFESKLPIDKPVAIYYRQSSINQVGNVSTLIQTVDVKLYLLNQGWIEENIIILDMDAGISGRSKIDERPGMKALFSLIINREIGAIACQDEDRLFRDITQIQVNIFIEACRDSGVFIITPTMIYDFAGEAGIFHVNQFRLKSHIAAEYLNSFVEGKLNYARHRLIKGGKWAGGIVPVGYMVDMREKIEGNFNEGYRSYVPFTPYANVIRVYFEKFLECKGCLALTTRSIHHKGPFYPSPFLCLPPEGFITQYRMKQYDNGYCPSTTGLGSLLSNPSYLGHWTFKNTIIRWHNHEAIVAEDVFMQAYNYLCEVTLDGQPNSSYKPFYQYTASSHKEPRTKDHPLYAGLIFTSSKGEIKNVGTSWVIAQKRYEYIAKSDHPYKRYKWSRSADYVDNAITQLLHEKLNTSFNSQVWQETLWDFNIAYEQERKSKLAQLKSLEQVIQHQTINFNNQDILAMGSDKELRYEQTKAEYTRLLQELEIKENEARQMLALCSMEADYNDIVANWNILSRNKKLTIINAFIDRIEAIPIRYGLEIVVYWRDKHSGKIVIRNRPQSGKMWLQDEIDSLMSLLDGKVTQLQIAAAFPDRKWKEIRAKIYSIRGKGTYHFSPKPIKDNESYRMYSSVNTLPKSVN